MGSEPSAGSGEKLAEGPRPTARPVSRRRKRKIMIVVVVVAAALLLVLWGWSSTGAREYLQVGTLCEESSGGSIPNKYLGTVLEVQGIITGWGGQPSNVTFQLADMTNASLTIDVRLAGTLPEGFENGKTAVVKGLLDDALPLTLAASEVTLGCASRY